MINGKYLTSLIFGVLMLFLFLALYTQTMSNQSRDCFNRVKTQWSLQYESGKDREYVQYGRDSSAEIIANNVSFLIRDFYEFLL